MEILITLMQSSEGDGGTSTATAITVLIFAAIGFVLYMLPTLIASSRHHKQIVPLGVINFFLGWTFFGWIACLAWAFQSYKGETPTADAASS